MPRPPSADSPRLASRAILAECGGRTARGRTSESPAGGHWPAAAAAAAIAVAALGLEAAVLPGAAVPALGALPAVVIISALLLGRGALLWTGPLAMAAVALPTLLGLCGLGSLAGPVPGAI